MFANSRNRGAANRRTRPTLATDQRGNLTARMVAPGTPARLPRTFWRWLASLAADFAAHVKRGPSANLVAVLVLVGLILNSIVFGVVLGGGR